MRNLQRRMRGTALGGLLAMGTLCQFGGCDLGQITTTTTTTLDGREVLINLLRSAILNPIDAYITLQVNNLFDDDED